MSREESSFRRLLFAPRAGKLRAMKAFFSLADQVKLSMLDASDEPREVTYQLPPRGKEVQCMCVRNQAVTIIIAARLFRESDLNQRNTQ